MTTEEQPLKEASVSLSPKAVEATRLYQQEDPSRLGKSLRLYLDGKGCDGFYYGVSFDEPADGDLHFVQDGIDIIVDPDTLEFVVGSEIDWVNDERGRGYL